MDIIYILKIIIYIYIYIYIYKKGKKWSSSYVTRETTLYIYKYIYMRENERKTDRDKKREH